MKKYLVFFGDIYYPLQGIYDFKESFDTLEEAQASIEDTKKEPRVWWHIADRDTLQILEKGENR